jgi:hypothetical protein
VVIQKLPQDCAGSLRLLQNRVMASVGYDFQLSARNVLSHQFSVS